MNLFTIAYNTSLEKLYGINSCLDDLKTIVKATFIESYPDCGVNSCITIEDNIASEPITITCEQAQVEKIAVACVTAVVIKL